jgi:hypothetical protein
MKIITTFLVSSDGVFTQSLQVTPSLYIYVNDAGVDGNVVVFEHPQYSFQILIYVLMDCPRYDTIIFHGRARCDMI